jgi:hypothetical protein
VAEDAEQKIPMHAKLPPVVFLAVSRTTLPPAHVYHADDATAHAFRWLLALGFPADVAAARVMPELFADPVAGAGTITPFPPPTPTRRAA